MCIELVAKGVPSDSSIVDVHLEVKNLLYYFVDMVPDELPSELPPLRDIHHAIELVPGSQLPNLPHYRINPKEREKLNSFPTTCLDFGIIYDEVSNGNRHEYVDFLVKNGYLFKAIKLCIPRTSFRDLLIWEMHAGGLAG